MTALKIIRDFFPCDLSRDAPRTKRRKKSESSLRHVMEGGSEVQKNQQQQNEILSKVAPSLFVAHALAENGLPDRIDPLSIEYLMEFDYDDGTFHHDMPTEVLMAVKSGNVDALTRHYVTRDRLLAQRNSHGETLLHLACRLGSVALVKSLLCDAQMSALVLDRKGRTPLHSLCMAMDAKNVRDVTNYPNCDQLESMRLLLREKSTLVVFQDKEGKVPLQYIRQSECMKTNDDHQRTLLYSVINEMLASEQVVERVVEEISSRAKSLRLGQRLSTIEKINTLLDFSGIEAAIMETGLSI